MATTAPTTEHKEVTKSEHRHASTDGTCSATSMFGDCGRRGCGHSIAYHAPLVGCMKCGCSEYR